MAESAKILSPEKTVVLPDVQAGCPMADMITAEQLRAMKAAHPSAAVVCYVNSSAEVKAESDICCTSSNAVNVVRSIPAEQPVIFVPDRNLGSYVESQTGRKMILWEGCCPIHDVLKSRILRNRNICILKPFWSCIPSVRLRFAGKLISSALLEVCCNISKTVPPASLLSGPKKDSCILCGKIARTSNFIWRVPVSNAVI
jgi:quinolinate synthase